MLRGVVVADPLPAQSGLNPFYGITEGSNVATQPATNTGLSFLSNANATVTQGMNSIGALLASTFSFKDQVKGIISGDQTTYSNVGGATAAATATSAVNPVVGGIPVLPFAIGGALLLGLVLLMRK